MPHQLELLLVPRVERPLVVCSRQPRLLSSFQDSSGPSFLDCYMLPVSTHELVHTRSCPWLASGRLLVTSPCFERLSLWQFLQKLIVPHFLLPSQWKQSHRKILKPSALLFLSHMRKAPRGSLTALGKELVSSRLFSLSSSIFWFKLLRD